MAETVEEKIIRDIKLAQRDQGVAEMVAKIARGEVAWCKIEEIRLEKNGNVTVVVSQVNPDGRSAGNFSYELPADTYRRFSR